LSGRCVTTNLPVVEEFTASSTNVPPGMTVTLTWRVTGATTVAIDGGIGAVAAIGHTSLTPPETATYTLTATNAAGTAHGSTTVTVSTVTAVYLTDMTVVVGETMALTAQVTVGTGTPDLALDWSVDPQSQGTVFPSRGVTTTYAAPAEPGTYKVWGTSVWDPTRTDYGWIRVTPPPNTWRSRAHMPTPRRSLAAVTLNDRIYALGGCERANTNPYAPCPSGAVEEYDPTTDSWTTKAPMPTPRSDLAAVALDGKIYAIGGLSSDSLYSGVKVVEVYDPASDVWTSGPEMHGVRGDLAAAVAAGKIYAIGGMGDAGCLDTMTTLEEFDPVSNVWIDRGSMPTARCVSAAATVDGMLYALSGNTNERYNVVSNFWSTQPAMLTPRAGFDAAVIGDKIYLLGGTPWSSSNEVFDTATGTWTTLTPAPDRGDPAVAAWNGYVYAIGGRYSHGAVNRVDQFTPP
jgi:N-acetylneuraminic acid mutarotase